MNRMTPKLLLVSLMALVMTGCSQSLVKNPLDPQRAPKSGEGWIALFNGENLDGWRPRTQERPMSWSVQDGILVNESSHEQHGVDIISNRRFDNFALYYEYKVEPNSNSGLYLRGRYELQILDNQSDTQPTHGNGAFYNTKAPEKEVSKGPGEWQSVYVCMVGNMTCVYLNGEMIHCRYELPGPTGGQLDNEVGTPGPIMLQGDHGSLSFRAIYIKPIDTLDGCDCPQCSQVLGAVATDGDQKQCPLAEKEKPAGCGGCTGG